MKIEEILKTIRDIIEIEKSSVQTLESLSKNLNKLVDHLNQTEEVQMSEDGVYAMTADGKVYKNGKEISTPQEVGDWEERFNEEFSEDTFQDPHKGLRNDLKLFITTLLAKKKAEVVERIEAIPTNAVTLCNSKEECEINFHNLKQVLKRTLID